MRKKNNFTEFNPFDNHDFDKPFEDSDDFEEPDEWTVIIALNRVLDLARDSKLSQDFWEKAEKPLDFLSAKLDLTKIQAIIVAIMVETGEPMSWRKIAEFLDCTRLSIMCYTDDVENLIKKRWITKSISHERGRSYEAFELVNGVIAALRHNAPFIPKKIDGFNLQSFIGMMESRLGRNNYYMNSRIDEDERWIAMMCEANPQLPLCKTLTRLKKDSDIHTVSLLMLIIVDYSQWAGSKDEGLTYDTIDDIYPDDFEVDFMREALIRGDHDLFKEGFIEHACNDGMADNMRYSLTKKAKDELLAGFNPSRTRCNKRQDFKNFLTSHKKIKEKKMFYNSADQAQIERIEQLLSKDSLKSIQQRLEEEGMRKGVACLFYGYPGTGKTETVLQIARKTGRDIFQIDIAGMRDKYVGESEKHIKEVFVRYREMCKSARVTPILFFNEADGIFGKRSTSGFNPSVEKMDNAMQNIILQEMETLDGILIATTNLTCNLDDAFDRRFLFKVEFHKPDTDAKTKLWQSMLGENITLEQATAFASRYDLSGGQIENIARKSAIDYILSGIRSTTEQLDSYCKAEIMGKKGQSRFVGFTS